jgi:hypothetical protein
MALLLDLHLCHLDFGALDGSVLGLFSLNSIHACENVSDLIVGSKSELDL